MDRIMIDSKWTVFNVFVLTVLLTMNSCSNDQSSNDITDFGQITEWSEFSPGLQCRLKLFKRLYSIGENIPVTLEIQNVSEKVSSLKVILVKGIFQIHTLEGNLLPYRGPVSTQIATIISLNPNESYSFKRDLLQVNYDLSEGSYLIHFEKQTLPKEGYISALIKTPSLEFEITKNKK